MKNTIKFLAIILLSITFNSCSDDVQELTDVNISTSLTEKIDVQIGETQEYISKAITLNLDNTDTHSYLDKLKTLEIKKLTYKFIDFTGNDSCGMNVEISTDNNVFETKDFIIKTEVDNQTVFEITDVAKLNAMSTALLNNKQVSFKMEGEVFDGAANFKVEVTVEVDIVANPL